MNNKLIYLFILMLPFVLANTEEMYVLQLQSTGGILTSQGVSLTQGYPTPSLKSPSAHIAELISFSGTILSTTHFNVPIALQPGKANDSFSSSVPLLPIQFQLLIPSAADGKTIRIKNPAGAKVINVDVGFLAKVCGDTVCQPHESFNDCPSDCPSGGPDDFCSTNNDNTCDPDCESDPDCRGTGRIIIFFSAAIILLAAIVIMIRRKRRVTQPVKIYPQSG